MASTAWGRCLAGGLAVLFGVATVVAGSTMLFGGPEARAGAGHVVAFVLVFNFAAGFVYVLAGAGTLLGRRWALGLARVLAGSTLVVFVALDLYAVTGGEVEARTLLAMTLRALFWVGQALVLRRLLARPAPG